MGRRHRRRADALAIVTQDQTALRAAPRESAPQQPLLWQGELLEVRGERLDYLQVYDHRRERGGFVRASQVRALRCGEAEAPELLAVVRFLRDTPGAEALGIAYAAAYLQAAPAEARSPPRRSMRSARSPTGWRAAPRRRRPAAATHRCRRTWRWPARYGVAFASFERDGRCRSATTATPSAACSPWPRRPRPAAARRARRARADAPRLRRPGPARRTNGRRSTAGAPGCSTASSAATAQLAEVTKNRVAPAPRRRLGAIAFAQTRVAPRRRRPPRSARSTSWPRSTRAS